MTPFHIRENLNRLLRWYHKRKRGPIERYDVTFLLPDGQRQAVAAERHYTLVMASQLIETPIHTGCPDGHCGQCNVIVIEGADSLQPPSENETRVMDEMLGKDRDPRTRLACHARVQGPGITVQVQNVWRLEDVRGEE